MSAVTSAAPLRAERASARLLPRALVGIATALTILGASLALLLTPLWTHWALDAAGSERFTGQDIVGVYSVSDRTIGDLVWGPGTFGRDETCTPGNRVLTADLYRCFYDAAEASHLRDARVVLYGFAAVVLVSAIGLGVAAARTHDRASFWGAVSRGAGTLAVVFALLGVFFLVAFDAAFTLFHQIFFPGGNWAFDPSTQRLVQLYPIPFWQLTSMALGTLTIAGGALVWWIARRRAGFHEEREPRA